MVHNSSPAFLCREARGLISGHTCPPHRTPAKARRGVDTFEIILCTNGSQLFACIPLPGGAGTNIRPHLPPTPDTGK
ncbi:hypothetical protein, partial [Kamptonema formosum]|uniref:hypothetical protein n=1 Tax=Kamptonema formosum TaxID=331992 RepID=UPI001E31ED82